MAIQHAMTALTRFLESEESSALALTGAWGVGKTFAWRRALLAAKDRLTRKSYCYVSLFGLKTVADLRMALFAKMEASATLGQKLDFDTVNDEWASLSWGYLRRAAARFQSIIRSLPYGGNTVSIGIDTFAPFFVRDMLVCLDDFERSTIPTGELLGLISELKEERNCKVALIFNLEKLAERGDHYREYKEKVVDIEIAYDPSADESFELVFAEETDSRDLIRSHVRDFGVVNIRVLRKIRDATALVLSATVGMHESVKTEALVSAIVLTWIAYSPDATKPRIEDIATWNQALTRSASADGLPPWVPTLKRIGFSYVNDVDLAVARVVERGYVDGTGLVELCQQRSDELRAQDEAGPFAAIWRRFHYTFADDQQSFAEEMHRAAIDAVPEMSVGDLSSTFTLLCQLDRDDLANELLTRFIERRRAQGGVFDLANHPFGGSVSNSRVREAFDVVHRELAPLPSFRQAVMLAREGSIDPQILQVMSKATADDYYDLFVDEYGPDELPRIVKACLRWTNGEYAVISERATDALLRVAGKGRLNELRVARYGIGEPPAADNVAV